MCVCMSGWPDPVISILFRCLDFFFFSFLLLCIPMLVFLDFSSATSIIVGCCDNANTDDYDGGGDDITIFF